MLNTKSDIIIKRVFSYTLLLLFVFSKMSCRKSQTEPSNEVSHIEIDMGDYWLTVANCNAGSTKTNKTSSTAYGNHYAWNLNDEQHDAGIRKYEAGGGCNNFLDGSWRLPNKGELNAIGEKLVEFHGDAPKLMNENQNSKNNQFVYFPYAGYKYLYNDEAIYEQSHVGRYWSSESESKELANSISFNSEGVTYINVGNKTEALSVRCVKGDIPDTNPIETVEIDILINDYWITVPDRNVGASSESTASESSFGDYFAWNRSDNSFGASAGTSDSEAAGACNSFNHDDKTWRLPTKTELEIIASKLVKSDNGTPTLKDEKNNRSKFVYFPLSGYKKYYSLESVSDRGNIGCYWSSDSRNDSDAWFLNFDANGNNSIEEIGRTYGYSIRCVKGDIPPTNTQATEINIKVDNYWLTIAGYNAGVSDETTLSATSYGNLYSWNSGGGNDLGEGDAEAGGACNNFKNEVGKWRLPTKSELEAICNKLIITTTHTKLMNENGDANQFTYFPFAGYKINSNGITNYADYGGWYWASDSEENGKAWSMSFNSSENKLIHGANKTTLFSVRCVKDAV